MFVTRVLLAAKGPKANITGFNIRDYRAAAGTPKYDPWARNEIWRSTGVFSRYNRFKDALPGIGIGTSAFFLFCIFEHFFLNDDERKHGDEHHKSDKDATHS